MDIIKKKLPQNEIISFLSVIHKLNFNARVGIDSISMAFDNSIRLNRYSAMRYIILTPRVRFCPDLTAAFSRRFIYLICNSFFRSTSDSQLMARDVSRSQR